MGGVVTYLLLQANAPIIEILSSSQKAPVAINVLFLMPPQCGKTELGGRGLVYLVQFTDGSQLLLDFIGDLALKISPFFADKVIITRLVHWFSLQYNKEKKYVINDNFRPPKSKLVPIKAKEGLFSPYSFD